MPLVSIIIPNFNRENIVGETVQNMLDQTHEPKEIIVVDDGSTDRSLEALEEFGDQIQVIAQKNAGPGAARNAGLRAAKGEFVQFMDSDDLALPNKLATQVAALTKTGADIAIGPWIQAKINDRQIELLGGVFQAKGLPEGDLAESLACDWAIMLQPSIFRRELAERVGGVPEQFCSPEDTAFLLKCLLAGAKVIHTPDTLVLYRVDNEGKLTGSGMANLKREVEMARYLLWLREQFLAAREQQDPLDWIAYRGRLLNTEQQLQKLGEDDWREQVRSLLDSRPAFLQSPRLFFRGLASRLRGGLSQRIVGYRGHSAYRLAPVSPHQRKMIEDSDFVLAS